MVVVAGAATRPMTTRKSARCLAAALGQVSFRAAEERAAAVAMDRWTNAHLAARLVIACARALPVAALGLPNWALSQLRRSSYSGRCLVREVAAAAQTLAACWPEQGDAGAPSDAVPSPMKERCSVAAPRLPLPSVCLDPPGCRAAQGSTLSNRLGLN